MVPIAKSNQNTSSGPSNRKGTSPRTVEMTVSITAQHHESRKATLVKRKIRKAEHEKHTYERNWYQQDDSQRIFKRLERHAAHDIDDSSHQKQKPCVFPTLFLTPAPVRRRRSLVPDRQQFFIEIFDSIVYEFLRQFIRPYEIEPYRNFIRLVVSSYRESGTTLYKDEKLRIGLEEMIYAFDSSTIELCLKLCPWAEFHHGKGAFKMHTLLDLRGSIPTFVMLTPGKVNDAKVMDKIPVEAGTFYLMDKGYVAFVMVKFLRTAVKKIIKRE